VPRTGELDETLPSDSDAGGVGSNTATKPGGEVPEAARDPGIPQSISRFSIDGKLGAGAMGVVLLATDPMLGRKVALKLMRDGTASADRTRRFIREAQAMAKVVHDNVIVVHEVGEHQGKVYVAMEHVGGGTLARWQKGRPWREIVETYVRAGRGLSAAHVAGLVHRDFKPENVLIADDGRVRVTDFGLVSALEGAGADLGDSDTLPPQAMLELEHSLTHTGALLGTPRYMAPEQHLGQPVDARADQYAFCVALYEALYGRTPYDGATYAELAKQVIEGAAVTPPDGRVPAAIRDALLRGLARNRDERFPTMQELITALTDGLAEPRPPKRHARTWIAAGAVAIALGGTAGLAWKMRTDARRADALEKELDQLKMKTAPMAASAPTPGSGAQPVAAIRAADVRRAQKAFETAQSAYLEKRYDEAARGFVAAYEYAHYPQFLYNAAAAYQMQGKQTKDAGTLRAAMRMYRQYLAEDPAAEDRATIEKALAALDALATDLED